MVEREVGDEWIAERLKAEANRYEPDLDRIRQRILERRGVDEPVRRSAWLLPAAAATFLVVAAGVITAVNSGDSGPGQVKVIGPAGSVTAPAPTHAVRPSSVVPSSKSSAASATTSGPIPSTSSRSSKPGVSSASPTNPSSEPSSDVELQLVAAESDQAVTLPGDAEDWIVAGSQSASQTVRRAHGDQLISGPHETGNATSTTASGPFSMSWTGGNSEPTISGSRTWRTVTGRADGPETGLLFRVPAGKQTGSLTLYVGANGADGQLRTRLGTQGKVSKTRLKAVDGGYVATIQFHTDGPDDQLTVELICGSGGSISFAAATLR